MTKILERAFEKAKTLPTNRQDEVGEILLDLVDQDHSEFRLTPDQEAEVRRRLASPEPLVPAPEMKAFFRKLTE
jgi:hypothetical protein